MDHPDVDQLLACQFEPVPGTGWVGTGRLFETASASFGAVDSLKSITIMVGKPLDKVPDTALWKAEMAGLILRPVSGAMHFLSWGADGPNCSELMPLFFQKVDAMTR